VPGPWLADRPHGPRPLSNRGRPATGAPPAADWHAGRPALVALPHRTARCPAEIWPAPVASASCRHPAPGGHPGRAPDRCRSGTTPTPLRAVCRSGHRDASLPAKVSDRPASSTVGPPIAPEPRPDRTGRRLTHTCLLTLEPATAY